MKKKNQPTTKQMSGKMNEQATQRTKDKRMSKQKKVQKIITKRNMV